MARILIVDDSKSWRDLLSLWLEPLGHELVLCADGEEAERQIEEHVPDLVILDIVMPGKNGFEVCRDLRNRSLTRKLPILVVTQMDRESDRSWGLKQGANDYLTKPVDGKLLVEKVRHLLSGR